MLSTLPCSAFLYLQYVFGKVSSLYPTSIKIIKNEVGCRDDTVPKTVDTRRHCEEEWEHATIFRNPQKLRCRDWVAEDCCMLSLLLAVPSCIYSFWHGVIPTSYFIFILVSLIFLSRLSLDCNTRRDAIRSTHSTRIAGSCFLKVRHYHTMQKAHYARK